MIANYSGRQPNSTSYIKNFTTQGAFNLWNNIQYTYGTKTEGALITSSVQYYPNVVVPGNLYVGGNIIHTNTNTSLQIRENISPISQESIDTIMNLTPVQFSYKDKDEDTSSEKNKIYYGFTNELDYVSLIPIMLQKIKDLQEQIDKINSQ